MLKLGKVVKRLVEQNHADCVFDMIGQSDMLSFYGTEKKEKKKKKKDRWGHRRLSGTKKTKSHSV